MTGNATIRRALMKNCSTCAHYTISDYSPVLSRMTMGCYAGIALFWGPDGEQIENPPDFCCSEYIEGSPILAQGDEGPTVDLSDVPATEKYRWTT